MFRTLSTPYLQPQSPPAELPLGAAAIFRNRTHILSPAQPVGADTPGNSPDPVRSDLPGLLREHTSCRRDKALYLGAVFALVTFCVASR